MDRAADVEADRSAVESGSFQTWRIGTSEAPTTVIAETASAKIRTHGSTRTSVTNDVESGARAAKWPASAMAPAVNARQTPVPTSTNSVLSTTTGRLTASRGAQAEDTASSCSRRRPAINKSPAALASPDWRLCQTQITATLLTITVHVR